MHYYIIIITTPIFQVICAFNIYHLRHLSGLQAAHSQSPPCWTNGPSMCAKQHIMPVLKIQLIQLLELGSGTVCCGPTWLNFANSWQSSWAGIGLDVGWLIFDISYLYSTNIYHTYNTWQLRVTCKNSRSVGSKFKRNHTNGLTSLKIESQSKESMPC